MSARGNRCRLLATSALTALALCALSGQARAQEVIDGGAHQIVDGDGLGAGAPPSTEASPWNAVNGLIVGENTTGFLTVRNAGAVSALAGWVGFNAGSTGEATVTGAGSAWTNTDFLMVGGEGTGALTVADGGGVSNTDGYLGFVAGSIGEVTVTGAGSTWTNSDELTVGLAGTGALTIADGGAVSNTSGHVGFAAGSTGDVIVTGAGSTWTNSGDLFVGNAGTGALTIADGGAVFNMDGHIGDLAGSSGEVTVTGTNSTWSNSGLLYVGNAGDGTLTIADGGSVSATVVTIAADASATGVLNIGADSTDPLDAVAAGSLNSATLLFGPGTGTLNFNHTNTDYEFGAGIGGVGTVNQYAGTTRLTAANTYSGATNLFGGVLSAEHDNALGTSTLTASGGVLRSGAGVSLGNSIVLAGDGVQVSITGGATLSGVISESGGARGLEKTGTGALTLSGANTFTGELDISQGSVVVNGGAALANSVAVNVSTGAALQVSASETIGSVGGAGSLILNPGATLTTGGNNSSTTLSGVISGGGGLTKTGTGALTLSGANTYTGATILEGGTLTLGHDNALGGSTLTTLGSVVDYADGVTIGSAIVIDSNTTQFQVLTGSATQSGVVSENNGPRPFEKIGAGELVLTVANAWTGTTTVREGTLTFDGGSVALGANFIVGDQNGDDGTLRIENGGAVVSNNGRIGNNAGSAGAATVTGAGSSWTNSGLLLVGASGDGTLTIENGGAVSNDFGRIGNFSGSTGAVTVTGAGSTWTNSNTLHIGLSGDGTLTIENGGEVSNTSGVIGVLTASTSAVTVTGANSRWTNSDILRVGDSGDGTLTISNGGAVSATGVTIANSFSATGVLNIGANSTDPLDAAGAGTLNTPTVAFGAGTGAINFNHTGTNYDFASVISGAGTINLHAGHTILSGNNTYTGDTFLRGGTLTLGHDNALGGSTLTTLGSVVDYADGVDSGNAVVIDSETTQFHVTAGAAATQSGDISELNGPRPFEKTGAGTLTLSGINTFTGALTVSEGALTLTGGSAVQDDVAVTVAAGASLSVQGGEAFGSLAGAGAVDIAGFTVTGQNNASTTVSGVLSGAGTLVKIGTGAMTLSGANTFSGELRADSGAVRLAHDSAMGTGQISARGATIDYADGVVIANAMSLDTSGNTVNVSAGTATQAGAIGQTGGPRELTKTGAGTLILTGVNTYTGPTTINGGMLVVNGSLASAVTVGGGSVLGGSGTFGAVTASAGAILVPGNSIGTLNVADITFDPGSIYEVEIAADGTSDRIAASGTATINGGTVEIVYFDPLASYTTAQTYTILTAGGGVTGTFDALDNPSAFFNAELVYDAGAVRLDVAPVEVVTPPPPPPPPGPGPVTPPPPAPPAVVALTVAAATANQFGAASGAQFLARSGDALDVYASILPLGVSGARAAFDALSGEYHASARHAALAGADLFHATLARRAGLPGSAGMTERNAGGTALWGAALGESGKVTADGNAAELEHRFAGAAFGAEGGAAMPGGTLTGGVAAGFMDGRGSVDGRASYGGIESWHAGIYGAWDNDAIRVSGAVSYASAEIDSTRLIGWQDLAPRTAEATRDAQTVGAGLEAAWRLPFSAPAFSLAPVAVVEYFAGSADAAQETGAGALDLAIAEKDYSRLDAGAGFIAGHATGRYRIEARAVYLRNLDGDTPTQALTLAGSPNAPFAVLAPDSGPDRVEVGAGVEAALTAQLSIAARYDGALSSDGDRHQATLSANWRF